MNALSGRQRPAQIIGLKSDYRFQTQAFENDNHFS